MALKIAVVFSGSGAPTWVMPQQVPTPTAMASIAMTVPMSKDRFTELNTVLSLAATGITMRRAGRVPRIGLTCRCAWMGLAVGAARLSLWGATRKTQIPMCKHKVDKYYTFS